MPYPPFIKTRTMLNVTKISVRFALTLFLIFTVASCATTRKALDFDTALNLTVSASKDVNPTSSGHPAPIVLEVIKLRDDRQFKNEDFINLFEDPKGRLGNDLIEITKLKELAPGERRKEKITLTPEVKYVGILAEFIQYDQAKAKLVIPIEAYSTNSADVRVERLNIRLADG